MDIAIVGTGYVGLLNAMLLTQNHQMVVPDVVVEKVVLLNQENRQLLMLRLKIFDQ